MSQDEEWRLADAERCNDDMRKSLRPFCTENQIDRLFNPLEEKNVSDKNNPK